MTNKKKIGRALQGLAVLLSLAPLAQAGSFSVNPVRVTLSAKEMVAALTVRNEGTEPSVVQLETFSWTQIDGKDALAPTDEVLATPPILTIPPGASRIMRVGLRRPPDPQRELTYRLTLREVPPPQPLAQALRVALLVSLPVFVNPPNSVAPQLQWSASRTVNGDLRVQVQNNGTAHIQLGKLEVLPMDGDAVLAGLNTAEYVLPGSSREWVMKTMTPTALGASLRISSQTDMGNVVAQVRPDDPAHSLASTATVAGSH